MAYTKEQLVDALTKAVGDTAYGKKIIADAEANYGADGKYAQNIKDRLDDMIGSEGGWEKKHEAEGEVAKAEAEEDRIAIAKKALAAVEAL